MSEICPICGLSGEINSQPSMSHGGGKYFSCQKCGDFFASDHILTGIDEILNGDDEKIAILSHAIRRMQKNNEWPKLDTVIVERILKNKLPSQFEQSNNLILWLGEYSPGYGEPVWERAIAIQSIIGSKNEIGLRFVLKHLKNRELVEAELPLNIDPKRKENIKLTYEGWDYFEKLKREAPDSRKAFMAMEFDDKTLDNVVDEIFRPAVQHTGFELEKLTDDPKAGLIDDRLRVKIRTSRFLIADLTHGNHGAYWEAGFAEGLGKPVIYTCEKEIFDDPKTKTHFDTNHHLTVIWDKDNLDEAAEQLKATIRATLPEDAKLTDDED